MTNEEKQVIKTICQCQSTVGTFEAMSKEPEFFKEKRYRLVLSDELELRFCIIKDTPVTCCPIYLPIDVCTDIKKLVNDMINNQDEVIDYGNLMAAFGVCGKTFSEAVKEYGYFGSDAVFYEGLKVHKWIVPRLNKYTNVTTEMVNSIEEYEEDLRFGKNVF